MPLAQVSVGTSATRLDTVSTSNQNRDITVYNAGSVDLWLGDSTVNVGNGIKLPPGGTATKRIGWKSSWWAAASVACQANVDAEAVV